MSGTNLSGTRTRYEEHERQLKEIQAQIAKHAKPGPGPVIDFRTYRPTSPLEFRCTADLTGRLYPHPASPSSRLYLLDFIDNSGTRRDVTNLYVYPCIERVSNPEPLEPMGSEPGRRGCTDLYTLPPGYMYEICAADQQPLKHVSFMYKNRITFELEPILRDP